MNGMKIIPDYLNGWKLVPDEDVEVFSGTNINIKTTFTDDTCTNDGKDYAECDQFVCSKCGIEIQDWHRVERDMDDGEVSYHEYTFRYCPHCGRRIVEGT